MKLFAIFLLLGTLFISCTEENITIFNEPQLTEEVIEIKNALTGDWKTNAFNITRLSDILKSREVYSYEFENICSVLDTLVPEKDIVDKYEVMSQKDKNDLLVIKKYRCSDKTDTLYWSIDLTSNTYSENLVNDKAFIISEKNKEREIVNIYEMLYFNIDTDNGDMRKLSVESVYKYDHSIYQTIQYNIIFSKK